MKSMNLRTTRIVGVVGLLLLVVLGWQFVVSPKSADLSEVKEKVSSTRDQNDLLALQLSTLKQQAQELDSVRVTAKALSSMFPATADQPRLFKEITQAASDAGIGQKGVTALSPTPPVVGGADANGGVAVVQTNFTLARQTVSVAVTGTYGQTQKLLANLERIPRAFLVTTVSLSGGQSAKEFTTTITGDMFLMPPVVDPADAEASFFDEKG